MGLLGGYRVGHIPVLINVQRAISRYYVGSVKGIALPIGQMSALEMNPMGSRSIPMQSQGRGDRHGTSYSFRIAGRIAMDEALESTTRAGYYYALIGGSDYPLVF